jgi:acyl-coenzyme A thioesterase PaaI-like protein
VIDSWSDRPISGISSPWSVEPEVRRHGDGVIARVTFGAAHEGAPDRCHGGIVAALFDDILGSVLSVIGQGAFTGELTVRYVAPVPLHRELLCECRIDSQDGRKLYLSGELTDNGQVVARATSIFIQPRMATTQTTFEPD